jgi:hypothetical protein
MSNTPSSPTPAAPSSAASTKAASRLRRDAASLLVDAKTTAAAVKANLAAFVAADADRAVKRIDGSWLTRFTSMVTAAETAVDGRAVRLGELKAATSTERGNAQELAAGIRSIRDDITTSYPGDKGIGQAFGFGATIDPKKTGALLQLAGQVAESFASPEWNARAVAAGVTQARIGALTALRASLSGADVSQQGLFATNVDGTVQKDALIKAVSESTAYARKVAGVVLKGNATALASFVPARARAARKEKKAKAAGAGATAAVESKKAPRKKASRGKPRARRAQVKARAKSLVVGPTTAAKGAKKAAPEKSATKRAK